jgi:DNA uptake protein ComE-like DNA-binding protein
MLGRWKVGGEEGTLADRCQKAGRVFCEVAEGLAIDSRVAMMAVRMLGSNPGALGHMLSDDDIRTHVENAIKAASEFFAHFEPKAEVVEEVQNADDDSSDVPTEQLDLPKATIDLLLAASTPELDLSTAKKILAANAKAPLQLTGGAPVRKKVLAAAESALKPKPAEEPKAEGKTEGETSADSQS